MWWNGDNVSNRYNKKLIFACRIVQQANPPSLMKPNNNVINAYILNVPSKSCHHTHSTSLTHVSRLLTHMLEKNAHMNVRLCLLARTRMCQHNEGDSCQANSRECEWAVQERLIFIPFTQCTCYTTYSKGIMINVKLQCLWNSNIRSFWFILMRFYTLSLHSIGAHVRRS